MDNGLLPKPFIRNHPLVPSNCEPNFTPREETIPKGNIYLTRQSMMLLYNPVTRQHLILLKIYVTILTNPAQPFRSLVLPKRPLITLTSTEGDTQLKEHIYSYTTSCTTTKPIAFDDSTTCVIVSYILAKSYIVYNLHLLPKALIHNNNNPIQYGGAPGATAIDVDSTKLPLITRFDNVIYPAKTSNIGVRNLSSTMQDRRQWQPRTNLPTRLGTHTLELSLPNSYQALIKTATSQDPNRVLLYWTNQPAQHITSTNLRELISHGSMTSHCVLNTFLEVLCHDNPISYLSTFFISILHQNNDWSSLRNWFASLEQPTPSKPTQNSEKPILLPCHVNGAH
jgi:hypothetical protein